MEKTQKSRLERAEEKYNNNRNNTMTVYVATCFNIASKSWLAFLHFFLDYLSLFYHNPGMIPVLKVISSLYITKQTL